MNKLLSEPKYVLSAGMVGSGSTYIFNLAREILRQDNAYPVLAIYSDDWRAEFKRRRHLLLKCHSGSPSLRAVVEAEFLPPLVSVRHPGDSVCSDMERFNLPFEHSLARVMASLEFALSLGSVPGARLFRYEDGFTADHATATAIMELLAIPVPAEILSEISAKYSADEVRLYANNLNNLPDIESNPENGDLWCATTHIHHNHIGKQISGRWRDLSVRHRTVIVDMLGAPAKKLGYAFDI